MAAAEIDLRVKIDTITHCALASHARAHGLDRQEVVRAVLGEWAAKQLHEARMLASCLRAKGEAGAAEGIARAAEGIARAAEGIARAAQGIAGQPGESLDWDES